MGSIPLQKENQSKIMCDLVKSIIRTELQNELQALRPEIAEGIANRVCTKVQEIMTTQKS